MMPPPLTVTLPAAGVILVAAFVLPKTTVLFVCMMKEHVPSFVQTPQANNVALVPNVRLPFRLRITSPTTVPVTLLVISVVAIAVLFALSMISWP